MRTETGRVDRSGWPDGPWKHEPDMAMWIDEETQWLCFINRSSAGSWNGYISIPDLHPWFRQREDVPVEVHGGVTYSGYWQDSGWWIGFDCNHSQDVAPGMVRGWFGDGWNHSYRDMEYATGQCRRMAQQARDAWMQIILSAVGLSVVG